MNKPSLSRFGSLFGRRDVSNRIAHGNLLARCVVTLGLALAPLAGLHADTSPTSATIRYTGTDFEGRQTFQLGWGAVSNATYLVQRASTLAPGTLWETLDAVQFRDTVGSYQFAVTATDSAGLPSSAQFYRLALPQADIFSVEPAVLAPGVAVDLYVLGQCFETNDVLTINGVDQTNTVFSGSDLLVRPVFTPGAPGVYTVQLKRSGTVRSSFAVTCADALANPELVLQEPPESPPAEPSKKEFKGHVTLLKAFDDDEPDALGKEFKGHVTLLKRGGSDSGAALGRHTKSGHVTLLKAFDDDQPEALGKEFKGHVTLLKRGGSDGGAALGRHTKTGHVTLLKAFDDGDEAASVRAFSGEVQQQVVDLAVEGRGLDFVWARTYRSRQTQNSSFGERWTHSYDVHLQPLGGDIIVHDGAGRTDTFKLQTNGTYTCPQFFREGTLTGGVFRLTFADTGFWEFNPLDGTATAGKLSKIVDRNGNRMLLLYGGGELTQIVDDLDRTNSIAYDVAGRVASVTDFSGRVVSYQYDGNGDLVACVSPAVIGTPNGNDFPGGKTNRYTYSSGYLDDRENHLLLSVIDASGQQVCDHVYQHNQTDLEFLHCISVQSWTNTPTILAWLPQTPVPSNHFATLRCVVNDPQGNVTEAFYDARNRCVMEREFTGRSTPGARVTDTANRPAEKLRVEDPDYYQTQWTWNNDSLCTRLVMDSHQIQCVYESNFDKSTHARRRADLRVVRELPAGGGVDVDGDGTLDLTELVWRFEYDPRFGSDPSARGKKLYVGNLPYADSTTEAAGSRGTGWEKVDNTGSVINNMRSRINELESHLKNIGLLGSSRAASKRFGIGDTSPEAPLGARIITDRDTGRSKGFGFVTSATDPRGIVSTGNYDTNGNLLRAAAYSRKSGTFIAADFNYKEHSRLAAITNAPDANGYRRVDVFDYYTNGPQAGYLSSIAIDEAGVHLTTSFEYDGRGNVTRCVDPRGKDWLYTWNTLDQCVRAQTPTNINARCATDYFYDANDNLVQCSTELRDATDNLASVRVDRAGYDGVHRLTETALAVDATHALTNRFFYNGNNECILALGGAAVSGADPHQAIAYEYDERGLPFREIAAPGTGLAGTNEFSYTATYQPATKKYVDDTDSLKTTLTYDGFDRLASLEDPMGNQTTFNYDANDNLKVIRCFGQTIDVPGTNGNLRLAESRCEYDDLDRLARTRASFFSLPSQAPIGDGERTTTFAYAPNGQCISSTDDLGRVTACSYDTAGRLSSVTAPAGKVVYTCLYDAAGNVVGVTQTDLSDLGGLPQLFSSTNVYDSLNRCVSTTDNVGNTSSCAYDSLNRVVRATDPRGIQSLYQYDLLGRRTLAVRDMDGDGIPDLAHDVSSSYMWSSSSDQLLASTDSHGNTTAYGYDSLSRCTSVTNADGTRMGLVWSPRSNLLSEQDPNGTVVVHTYDFNNRCVSNNIMPGTGVASTTTFETFAYDGRSHLVAATNDSSHAEFDYDSIGDVPGNHRDGWNVSSLYDSVGRRISLTYPGGRVLTYAYDALDQCTNIMETGSSLVSLSYDGPGRVSRIDYGNGTRAQFAYDGLTGTPNASGDFGFAEISSVTHAASLGSPQIVAVGLQWDPNGNKSARTDAIFAPAIPRTNDLALTYDAADELTQATLHSGPALLRNTVYGLDLMGNRTNVTGAASCSGDYSMDGSVPGPMDYQMNQYTTTPCDSRTYDDDGNLVNRGSSTGPATYQYDYAGRLVQLQTIDFSSGALVITTSTYAYDALGRRISKTVSSGGLPPITTEFFHDGASVIEEHENGAVTATYVLDGTRSHDDEVATTFHWTQLSGPFAMRRAGHDYYFHSDDQGNVLALTDSTGAVVERCDYDDYGAVTFLSSAGTPTGATSSSVGNPYCWGGLRLDAETGLQNNDGGDYLEPQTGRTVRGKVKVIRDMGGSSFAGNNPWSADGDSPDAMKKGTVKFFNETKGFGFVAGGGGGGGGGGGVFAIEPRNILKTYFETGDIPTEDQRILPRNVLKDFFQKGDKPTQSQFGALIDSMVNRIDDRYLLGMSARTKSRGSKDMVLKGQKILQN